MASKVVVGYAGAQRALGIVFGYGIPLPPIAPCS
jgi:hypothetical protein